MGWLLQIYCMSDPISLLLIITPVMHAQHAAYNAICYDGTACFSPFGSDFCHGDQSYKCSIELAIGIHFCW